MSLVLRLCHLWMKGSKWVYIIKYALYGSVERFKARLVAKGFSQVERIGYNETFVPVTKMNFIHLILALAALHKWEVGP